VTVSRPALLFLCQTLPYPPDGGVTIRTFNVLKLLAAKYDVYAICFYRKSTARDVPSSLEALRPYTSSIDVFPIDQEKSTLRLLRDHALSILTQRVYTRFAYDSAGVHARLRALLEERTYALVHADSLDLSGYFPMLGDTPIVCVHHNVESLLLKRRADAEPHLLRRLYLSLQARLMRSEERVWCPQVALNVVCSPDDRTVLQSLVPNVNVAIVPNGVDIEEFQPGSNDGTGVVFVGGMTWFPNKDALEYFTDSILPELERSGPLPRVLWVGRALEGAREYYGGRGVQLTGYVDDVKPYVHDAHCFVVPLRVGGGTRLKILAAWGMGKAVVSTSIGCEGLDVRDGWNILIRDDAAGFAAAIRELLSDAALRERLGANARTTVVEAYGWERIGEDMLATYKRVVT
jgi:glycosyltransferase involved in cell wall biosynthesis